MAITADGLNERQAALDAVMGGIRASMTAASKEAADIAVAAVKEAAPRRSGRLGESTRATASPTGVTLRVGGGGTPYAGVIVFGWSSRPNRARKWRGGPIRPNPYPYEALGKSGVEESIVLRYEEQMDRLTRRASDG